jgi:hypothetical protein
VCRYACSLHALRMSLRDAVLCDRIARSWLQRTERSLTGHAALQLLLHFLRSTLFERVRAAAQRQPCNREQD